MRYIWFTDFVTFEIQSLRICIKWFVLNISACKVY